MSYNPKHGERVIFRINPDGIDLYGTAVSESASNIALIQEDVEDGQIWAVPSSQIQPDDEAEPAVPSFWEAAKTYARCYRIAIDWYKAADDRAEQADSDLTQLDHEVREIHELVSNAAYFSAASTVEHVRNLVNELAVRTHGEALEIQELRDRATTAEAKVDEYREAWQSAETAFKDQLTMRRQAEDRNGVLESDLADVRSMARDLVEELDETRARGVKLRTSVVDAANSAGYENLSYLYSDTDEEIARVVGMLAREHDELADRADKAETALADRRDRVSNLKESRNEWRSRADKAEALIGPHVRDRLAEYRERTHAAEDDRDELRKEWLAAEERVFELGSELAELKAALRTLAGESE